MYIHTQQAFIVAMPWL